jgi:6-phosphogluconolactonase (cycloisomerase 2 family)
VKKYFFAAAILAAVGLWAGCGSSGPQALYAVSKTTNEVTGYTISGSTLTAINTPVSTSPGTVPVAAVAHPNGKFLYVADSGNDDVSVFSIDGSGGLTLSSTNAAAGNTPTALAMEPDGNYLFVADTGVNELTIYSIDSGSGDLTPITNSPYPLQFKPDCLIQDPVLTVLFAASKSEVISIPISSGAPEAYNVYSSSATFPAATNPKAMATDPASRFLYVADDATNVVYAYGIASDGSLSSITGSPFQLVSGVEPFSMAVDPSGSYLYVANQSSNNVSGFAITQGTGALTAVAGSPFTTGAGSSPSSVTFDGKSGNLYVANYGTSSISGFSMNSSTGVLTSLGAATQTYANPIWLTTVD